MALAKKGSDGFEAALGLAARRQRGPGNARRAGRPSGPCAGAGRGPRLRRRAQRLRQRDRRAEACAVRQFDWDAALATAGTGDVPAGWIDALWAQRPANGRAFDAALATVPKTSNMSLV